ncbi:RHS repeat domain-containing protein [Salegentibacter salinarum]|uniref:RHS repeat domain-containing protein n=1 Tax=Salegentibacter salinarum TaxID=447422 RepID=UPI001356360F|nr:hypothetical protein [Salegentibacter salinarum]
MLGTSSWITTTTGYDAKGRVIWVSSANEYLETTDVEEYELDFTGRIKRSKSTHSKNGASPIVVEDTYEYDHMSRQLKHTQCIDGDCVVEEDLVLDQVVTQSSSVKASNSITLEPGFEVMAGDSLTFSARIGIGGELIASNTYDGLGHLIKKGVGGVDSLSLQEVDYAYNIRGWLKQINDPEDLGDDLFGFGINYNDPTGGALPLFNGNISETHWNSQSENTSGNPVSNYYGYNYDAMNRITGASDNTANYNLSGITYDKMGNILSLQRQGYLDNSVTPFGKMDNLDYDYDGNKLLRVSEIEDGEAAYGFKDGNTTGDDYGYDVNGNLTSDANKGIAAGGIEYNHLNMPTKITLSNAGSNNGVIDYVYTAEGIKLQKKKTQAGVTTTTDYAGDFVYENNTLKQFYQPEGYIEPDGSDWQYVYQHKDIWDNVRVTYADDDNSGSVTSAEIRREQNYYPFGLEHKGYNINSYGSKNNLKTYQGQEFTEDLGLNTHEWKYRMSDPAIGRFWQIDPLAEDYTYNSTYAFQENKMGMGVELEGLELGLNKWFKKGVKWVARNSKGQLKPISRKSADRILKNRGSVTQTQIRGGNKKAKNLMQSTTDKKVVRHDGHELKSGKTGRNHYQKKSGDGSHVFTESVKDGAIVTAGINTDKVDEVTSKALEMGSEMTDAVENFGTNVFGDNAFGNFVDDMNPLNLGINELFNTFNEVLNPESNSASNDSNSSNTENSNNISVDNCEGEGCQ